MPWGVGFECVKPGMAEWAILQGSTRSSDERRSLRRASPKRVAVLIDVWDAAVAGGGGMGCWKPGMDKRARGISSGRVC